MALAVKPEAFLELWTGRDRPVACRSRGARRTHMQDIFIQKLALLRGA